MFLRTTPDASRVLLFVATLGDFTHGFKQSTLPHSNKPIKNTNTYTFAYFS